MRTTQDNNNPGSVLGSPRRTHRKRKHLPGHPSAVCNDSYNLCGGSDSIFFALLIRGRLRRVRQSNQLSHRILLRCKRNVWLRIRYRQYFSTPVPLDRQGLTLHRDNSISFIKNGHEISPIGVGCAQPSGSRWNSKFPLWREYSSGHR